MTYEFVLPPYFLNTIRISIRGKFLDILLFGSTISGLFKEIIFTIETGIESISRKKKNFDFQEITLLYL